jgi:hypothetical protein
MTLPKRSSLIVSTPKTRVFGINHNVMGGYEKTGILLFESHNESLERIRRAGLCISCYISLDDGCRYDYESGHDECACKRQFFKRVLANMNPEGMRLIGTHSPHMKIHNLMMSGEVGETDKVKIGGTRYTIRLTRDTVYGVPDACEILIQKNEIQDPMYLFTADDVRRARFRASHMMERIV